MKLWQFISDKNLASIEVILLYVLESKGSSPGRQGFKMAVAADGEFCGTIGGGVMEHKFVEMARSMLLKGESSTGLFKQVHDKTAKKEQSGMICSGEQTIFLYKIRQKDISHIVALINSLNENRNGTLHLSFSGIEFKNESPLHDYSFKIEKEVEFSFSEKSGYKNQLHIIGGGHCALALSKIMRELDFYIRVYDDRAGLNTMDENRFAHEKKTLNDYSELSTLIEGGENVYVVIMTVGYRTDDIALRSLMNKKFRYIGMLGSNIKVKKLMADYRNEKINAEILEQVHAPIGMQVNSRTAEEIAVSIAAEIISEKNKGQ